MLRWPMHSKYLKCDKCEAIIDRRALDDFGGNYKNTQARGAFAPDETRDLLEYAKTLGWGVSGEMHLCPLHKD